MATSKRRKSSVRPHLVARLSKGWTYEPESHCFSKTGREPVRPGDDLPKHTRIAFQIPSLARKSERTEAEDELARCIQIVPPRGEKPEGLLERVEAWPCVEKAWVAPEVSPAGPEAPRLHNSD